MNDQPTLAELLQRERDEDDDYLISHFSHHYHSEAADLPPELAADLSARLDDWWPSKPFAETVTWNSETSRASWSQENGAAAWTWYGPPLDKALTAEQWAGIATSGVVPYEEQTEWLRRQFTPEALVLATTLISGDDGDVWYQLFTAIPSDADLPAELVDAVVDQLKRAETYQLYRIGSRLIEVGADAVRRLMAVSEGFGPPLKPILARAGEEAELTELLVDLERRLIEKERPDSDELAWLDGLNVDAKWLEPLFACLLPAYLTPSGPPYNDPVSPLTAAIHKVSPADPEAAVRAYDEMFEKEPQTRWLRKRREAVVQEALMSQGIDASDAALKAIGIS